MEKRAKTILLNLSLIFILSISIVSASFFSDFWKKITGQVLEENLPDLTISKLEVYREEIYVVIDYCIKNIGTKESGPFYLKYSNLNNPSWDFGGGGFNSLPPSQEFCEKSRRSVPQEGGNGYVLGDNYIELFVDSNNEIIESDETNNKKVFNFYISGEEKIIETFYECYDTDGGINYWVKGTAKSNAPKPYEQEVTDSCFDSSLLQEAFCDRYGIIGVMGYYCPDGYICDDGACIEKAECIPKTCPILGKNCGIHDDQCGGTLNCGDCLDGYICDYGVCILENNSHGYVLEFGDPRFLKPFLNPWNSVIEVQIYCREINSEGRYNCDDHPNINSTITLAYASIIDPKENVVQKIDLIQQHYELFKGNFDFNNLTEEIYKIEVYAEDSNGVKKNVKDYSFFSGQGWNVCFFDEDCMKHHSCYDNKCILNDNINYNLGLVYVYNDEYTYNPQWENEFKEITNKVSDAIKKITNGKVNLSIEIIGEVKIDGFCWNSASPGIRCDSTYIQSPGSSFGINSTQVRCENIEIIDCHNCKIKNRIKTEIGIGNNTCSEGVPGWETLAGECNKEYPSFICDGSTGDLVLDCTICGCENGYFCDEISGECVTNLSRTAYEVIVECKDPSSSFFDIKLTDRMYEEISQKLQINFKDHKGAFIIFGKMGHILPNENELNLNYRCTHQLYSITGGYSNLVMAENSIKSGGPLWCGGKNLLLYDKTGWHAMVHEILHNFGAVDIYDTSTYFMAYDIRFYRERARLIDPRANESIMGNNDRECMYKDDEICTLEELERVYLDKYNRNKIGVVKFVDKDKTDRIFLPKIIDFLKRIFGFE